jgi:hypothetical protein
LGPRPTRSCQTWLCSGNRFCPVETSCQTPLPLVTSSTHQQLPHRAQALRDHHGRAVVVEVEGPSDGSRRGRLMHRRQGGGARGGGGGATATSRETSGKSTLMSNSPGLSAVSTHSPTPVRRDRSGGFRCRSRRERPRVRAQGARGGVFEHTPQHLYDVDDPCFGFVESSWSCSDGGDWGDYDHDSSQAAATWPAKPI